MEIKEVHARIILDSRREETIDVSINACRSSAPSGVSKGKHEKPSYIKNIKHDVDFINKINIKKLPRIYYFGDLEKIERLFANKIGANSLFALEASILKALAIEKKVEVWQIINPKLKFNLKNAKFPRIISNTVGGGAHSSNMRIKPDFQEFLIMCNKNPSFSYELNKKAYEKVGNVLNKLSSNVKTNDENAWTTDIDNDKILDVLKVVQKDILEQSNTGIEIGLDVAGSQLYNGKKGKNAKYIYRNRSKELNREEQINYIAEIVQKYNLFYIEDPLNEEDFPGFVELCKKVKCLVVGDDLTVTNLERTKKAIELGAITGIIIKPNQTGSLIEVRKIINLCEKKCIKTIVSHRSGETNESIIADIAFGFQVDYIKTPVMGKEREAKVRRLMNIENHIK